LYRLQSIHQFEAFRKKAPAKSVHLGLKKKTKVNSFQAGQKKTQSQSGMNA
jgi:hypothetical protein